MAARIVKFAGLVALAAALTASLASAKPYVADETGYAAVPASRALAAPTAPNDRAGAQGIGRNSTDFGMGGRYGQNLIEQKAQDIQKAKTFKLPAPPDERTGTSSAGTPLVIPYLSHGIGVDVAQFGGTPVSPDNRSGGRGAEPITQGNPTYDVGGVLVNPNAAPTPTAVAAPVSTGGDGFNWGIAGFGAAGLAAIALAIGLLVVLGRRSRHEGVAVS